MKTSRASLKQSAGSGTNFAARVARDRLFRTEVIIVASLFFLSLVHIVIVGVASHHLNLSTAEVLREANTTLWSQGPFVINPDETNIAIDRELSYFRTSTLIVASAVSIVMTVILGFFIGRAALQPTRNALATQKRFIANIAHEIRTPLSIIRANNEILRLEHANDKDVSEVAGSNLEELDRVSGIINNLLTLNAFNDQEQFTMEPVNVSRVLHTAIDTLASLMSSKGQGIKKDIDSDLFVLGNRSALDQIAINLLKNAAIYTPKGGSVRVTARALPDGYVELAITDTGIGIEASKLSHIFEPFYQVDPSRSGKGGSRGLGLAIVSELVKMHKGRITVRSAPNVGTTIRVSLPGAATPTSVEVAPQSREVELDFSRFTS